MTPYHTYSSCSVAGPGGSARLKLCGRFAESGVYDGRFGWQPSFDLYEEEAHFMVRFEMPGVSQQDLDVDLYQDALVVRGRKTLCGASDDSTETAAFQRTVRLPALIQVESVRCEHKNGILTVFAPKRDVSPVRPIEIVFVN